MKKIKTLTLIFCAFFALVFSSCDPAVKTDVLPDAAVDKSVKDPDGNVYHTITIGTQTWMVENLKTTKYRDGSLIDNVTDNTAWKALTTGGYCWYNNNVANKTKYGALYNWYAVNTGKLAPAGWHVPTDAEWTTLTNYVTAHLGTSLNVAKALAATTDWDTYNSTEAIGCNLSLNNSSGFYALPGGERDDSFAYIGTNGSWWTSSEGLPTYACHRGMYYRNSYLYDSSLPKRYGYSVRCIKD